MPITSVGRVTRLAPGPGGSWRVPAGATWRAWMWRAAVSSILTIAFGASASYPAAAAPPAQPRAPLTYALAETWSDLARPSVAGHYLAPQDISSLPDATIAVLSDAHGAADAVAGAANDHAVHLVWPDGTPRALVPIGREMATATRLDVGFGGRIDVLGQLRALPGSPWGVAHYDVGGVSPLAPFALTTPGMPVDVAVGPTDETYVTMGVVPGRPDQIDVYTPAGALRDTIVPAVRGADSRFTHELTRLDISSDGTIYVFALAWRVCPPGPPGPGVPPPRPPDPTPTPRPSLAGDDNADQVPPTPDFPCQKEIVLVFNADHSFREEVPNEHTTDIAVRDGIPYVSTDEPFRRPAQRIYALGADRATFTYRIPERLDLPVPLSTSHLQLDVAADGRVHAVVDLGDPFYRGALTFGDPAASRGPTTGPVAALGIYDEPGLEGPRHPRRIDAGSHVWLLESAYQAWPPDAQRSTAFDVQHDGSALVRWSLTGHPEWQAVQRSDGLRDNADGTDRERSVVPLTDLSADGADLYAISPQAVWHRSDALPPDWFRRTSGAHFLALSADDGRVAVLNGASGRVLVMDRRGRVLFDRPIGLDWTGRLAGDLALHGDRVYLADQGGNRILVRGIDGSVLGEFPTHDGSARVSIGPEGDVYVLGQGGYGLRYTPAGELVAAWRMPADHQGVPVDATDLAVGDDGRVYVSFLGLAEPTDRGAMTGRGGGHDITAGGVWIFEPRPVPDDPPPPPAQRRCEAEPDKRSWPPVILQGETIDVTLDVVGRCPGHYEKQQLFIVLDTSWSMHDNYFLGQPGLGSLSRAKEVLSAFLSSIDPSTIELGLVTFSGGAGIAVPLPGEVGAVRASVLSRLADGDTRMGVGVALAYGELRGPRGNRNVRQTILIVSDGVFKDDPRLEIQRAQADGIQVAAAILTTPEFDQSAKARLEVALGPGAPVFYNPVPETVRALIDQVSGYVPNPGLFETITIDDVVPDNMTYVLDSAVPPANWDSTARTLTWTLGPVAAAEPIRLTYRLTPRQPGYWRTNVRAGARYRDAWGNDGTLTFPVPFVTVLKPRMLVTPTVPTPTPSATPTATGTATPLPTATATPTPKQPPLYTIYIPTIVKQQYCVPKGHTDVVLVLDMSTSMYRLTRAGRTKHAAAQEAARLFVDQLQLIDPGDGAFDQVAVVGFNDWAWTETAFTNDRRQIDAALEGLLDQVREGTRLDAAVAEARRVIEGPTRRRDHRPAVILLTDGLPNRVPTPAPIGGQEDTVLAETQRLKGTAGTVVFTIGLGWPEDIRGWLMTLMASEPWMYYETPEGEDLIEIYQRIVEHLVCGKR